jgi:hypothetical protein
MTTNTLPAIALTLAALSFISIKPANADNDFIVYSPYVVQGRSEVEVAGFGTRDGRSDLNGAGGYNLSIAHGVSSWWKPELYIAEFNRNPGETVHASGYEFENTFQLGTPGEYWADVGFIASYAHSTLPGISNRAEFGPLFEKKSGNIDQRLNLIWEKEVGSGASNAYTFRSAYHIGYNIKTDRATYSPGIEAYYRPGDNANHIGPVFSGEFRTDKGSELEYSIGVVFGMNAGAPDKTILAKIEFEFF